MIVKNRIEAGFYFSIPMDNGRAAICQVVWIGGVEGDIKFKRVFAFLVTSIGESESSEEKEYLSFQERRGSFKVIFSSVEKIFSGEWAILGKGELKGQEFIDFEFNMAGNLYRRGEFVRKLDLGEYQQYCVMGVAGFVLVDKYLNQH